jgi:hypothetical protein
MPKEDPSDQHDSSATESTGMMGFKTASNQSQCAELIFLSLPVTLTDLAALAVEEKGPGSINEAPKQTEVRYRESLVR